MEDGQNSCGLLRISELQVKQSFNGRSIYSTDTILLANRQAENHNSASIPVYLLLNDVFNPPRHIRVTKNVHTPVASIEKQ